MAQPYIGELGMFAGNFPPAGWAFCDGSLLAIAENDALFTLLGTTYGGDGQETFALPNLQSRVPLHLGTGSDGITYQLGEQFGVESVMLNTQQLPVHNHVPIATGNNGDQPSPIGGVWASNAVVKPYNVNPPAVNMGVPSMSASGGSQPHDNIQPYLCINFIISLFGIFPSQQGSVATEPFLSELRMFAFNFVPGGWAMCNGQFLPINQNQALFSLLGTTYGGNGQTTFALPDLRGRVPIHKGSGHTQGETGGEAVHTLTTSEMPQHSHILNASSADGSLATPVNNFWGAHSERPYGAATSNLVAMNAAGTSNVGGSQPHENRMPSLALTFGIALQGIFPSQN
jgi:microcystin-dependent protein